MLIISQTSLNMFNCMLFLKSYLENFLEELCPQSLSAKCKKDTIPDSWKKCFGNSPLFSFTSLYNRFPLLIKYKNPSALKKYI